MTRVLSVSAALLWVAGVVVLIVGIVVLPDTVTEASFGPVNGPFATATLSEELAAVPWLVVGTVLVGVAGVMTAGLVLHRGRRRAA